MCVCGGGVVKESFSIPNSHCFIINFQKGRKNVDLLPEPAPISMVYKHQIPITLAHSSGLSFAPSNPAEHGSNRVQAREKFNHSCLSLPEGLSRYYGDRHLSASMQKGEK